MGGEDSDSLGAPEPTVCKRHPGWSAGEAAMVQCHPTELSHCLGTAGAGAWPWGEHHGGLKVQHVEATCQQVPWKEVVVAGLSPTRHDSDADEGEQKGRTAA